MTKPMTQTQLGQHFGLSSIAMGKKLTLLGLKDPVTKQATTSAISEHSIARITTYQKGGDVVLITLWSPEAIDYLTPLMTDCTTLAARMVGHLKEAKKHSDDYDDRGSKISDWLEQDALDKMRNLIKSQINKPEVITEFLKQIKKEKLLDFLEHSIFENTFPSLQIKAQRHELQTLTPVPTENSKKNQKI